MFIKFHDIFETEESSLQSASILRICEDWSDTNDDNEVDAIFENSKFWNSKTCFWNIWFSTESQWSVDDDINCMEGVIGKGGLNMVVELKCSLGKHVERFDDDSNNSLDELMLPMIL